MYVAASAHVAGAAGTNWRTDLEVHCWSDESASYTVELLKHGTNNSDPRIESFTLDAGREPRFRRHPRDRLWFHGCGGAADHADQRTGAGHQPDVQPAR